MKKGFFLAAIALAVFASALSAQTNSLKGMNLSGATGLYSIPTGRIGWERSADVGLDFGYHTIIDDKINHIPAVSASFFHWIELSLAFDIQPDIGEYGNNDLLMGFKIQLPTTSTAVAFGGSFQAINLGDDAINTTAFQIYAAVTYPGTLLGMPSETSVVVGKTFRDHNNSDIDFGMGFDLVVFPKVFQNYVHWITDFSNFDYSIGAWPNAGISTGSGGAAYRGVLNTGIRVDIAAAPALSKYKFAIDFMITDCFDDDRCFALGLTAGLPLK